MSTDPIKKCPSCTFGHLEVRRNRQTGQDFLGCTEYPRCHHTEPMPAYQAMLRAGVPELPGLEARSDID